MLCIHNEKLMVIVLKQDISKCNGILQRKFYISFRYFLFFEYKDETAMEQR